jgi:CRISPR-associated protein Cst1
LSLIVQNRAHLVKETFRNKKNLYANYANTNLFLNHTIQPHCRLVGYNVDEGRKSKSISYRFDLETFVHEDCLEFDFIPFAFTNTREAIYINNNFTVEQLMQTFRKLNQMIEEGLPEGKESAKEVNAKEVNAKEAMFQALITSADFIDFDVEVIVKDREKGFYETLFIRKDALKILRQIEPETAKSFCISHKYGMNYYLNVQNEVVNHILNNILLDDLIELFLKDGRKSSLIRQLIKINCQIKGGNSMTQEMKAAYACARKVVAKLEENKIKAYRQKLISSIIFHDYSRVRYFKMRKKLSAYYIRRE